LFSIVDGVAESVWRERCGAAMEYYKEIVNYYLKENNATTDDFFFNK
jgi:hypothetical protein